MKQLITFIKKEFHHIPVSYTHLDVYKRQVVIRDHTNQITYVVEGSGTVYLNGKEQNINAGNILLIESETTIRFIANAEGLTLFHLHIPDAGREDDRRILEGEDIDRYMIK